MTRGGKRFYNTFIDDYSRYIQECIFKETKMKQWMLLLSIKMK